MQNDDNLREDPKCKALLTLAEEIADSQFSEYHKNKVLTFIEKSAMIYVLDDLPEGKDFKYYCKELDNYIIKHIKEIK